VRLVILYALAALIALTFQTEAPRYLLSAALLPDLILILAVDLGLRHHNALAALLAFAMGYATDALSGTHLGLNAFILTFIFMLSYLVSRQIMIAGAGLGGAILVFFAVLIRAYASLAIGSGIAAVRDHEFAIFRLAITQASITAIVAPLVFGLLEEAKRLMGLPLHPSRE
jgi:rod shape-determining protein MreD